MKDKCGAVGSAPSGGKEKKKTKRRATFGGSRLSLHLFFPSSHSKEKEKMSRSANDLQENFGGSVESTAEEVEEEDEVVVAPMPAVHFGGKVKMKECPLCSTRQPSNCFPRFSCCSHRSCHSCLVQYLQLEILESRVIISCPECSELLHPNDIHKLLVDHTHLKDKYEEFSLRRTLMGDPDTRWCPAPDCNYAVIASGCAACPELRCQRPGCGAQFCYHCKMIWHPNMTCDEARAERDPFAANSLHMDSTIRPGDVKACPRCRTYIVKMNDGSCNHMVCGLCGAEFCWLCLKEISDLHYLSPSGCTFWGKKPWSKKKKLLWQLGMLIGAPVGIALIAGLAIPAIIFGVPVFVGRTIHQKRRNKLATSCFVVGSLVISPVLAAMAVGIGVPILLAYVYGVVPISLCRNGGCGVSASPSRVNVNDAEDDIMAMTGINDGHEKSQLLKEADRQIDGSIVTGVSIPSNSSMAPGGQSRLQVQAELCRRRPSIDSGAMSLGDRVNYEEASTKAMAGSTYCYDDKSVHTVGSHASAGLYSSEDQASTRALAGSVIETKSICGGAGISDRDSASLRVFTGSIGPDNVSARHLVHAETHHQSARSDRGSPAPLLEEGSEWSEDDQVSASTSGNGTESNSRRQRAYSSASYGNRSEVVEIIDEDQATTSKSAPFKSARLFSKHHRHHLKKMEEGDGEFMLLSQETLRQLQPGAFGRQYSAPVNQHKARSVSMLVDSGDLLQLLSEGASDPWAWLDWMRPPNTPTTSTQSTSGTGGPFRRLARSSAGSYTSLPDPSTVDVEAGSVRRLRRLRFPKLPRFMTKNKEER